MISRSFGMYPGSFTRGTKAWWSAWYSVGASGFMSATTVVAPARLNAVTMSTRRPPQVKRTAVMARSG